MTHFLIILIYLSFISLGLPDSLLGAAWPSMQPELGLLAGWFSISLLPFWLLALLSVMFFSHERLNRICR